MKPSFLKIAGRVILVSLYAYTVAKLVKFTLPEDFAFSPPLPKWALAILYLTVFNLNTEGNFLFNRFLNSKLPWSYFPKKRLLVQSSFVLGWSLLTIGTFFTVWFFILGGYLVYPPFSITVYISSVMLLVFVVGISVAIDSSRQWRTTQLEMERLEKEKLKSDYRALQNQVNPHFLFNSLNVLISEIKHDPETAETFTRRLSQVYRYVLQSKNHDLVSLKEEVEFVRSYVYLHKVRMGSALEVSIDIDSDSLEKHLPPLTLQILIENAIKHNVVTEEDPLHITIKASDRHTLLVKNNLNPKQSLDSTKTGLSNIRARYGLLRKDGLKIEKNATEYMVFVPILDEQ